MIRFAGDGEGGGHVWDTRHRLAGKHGGTTPQPFRTGHPVKGELTVGDGSDLDTAFEFNGSPPRSRRRARREPPRGRGLRRMGLRTPVGAVYHQPVPGATEITSTTRPTTSPSPWREPRSPTRSSGDSPPASSDRRSRLLIDGELGVGQLLGCIYCHHPSEADQKRSPMGADVGDRELPRRPHRPCQSCAGDKALRVVGVGEGPVRRSDREADPAAPHRHPLAHRLIRRGTRPPPGALPHPLRLARGCAWPWPPGRA